MTLYNQTKMTELEHTVQLLYKEALPVKMGTRDSSPMGC